MMVCEYSNQILCYYTNVTGQIQIARITNIPNLYFEHMIFPGQRLLFESLPNAELEIHKCAMGSETFVDKISCRCLCVNEGIKN